MTHILLQEGEIIKEGDEWYDNVLKRWVASNIIGSHYAEYLGPTRRPLPTKPKVSLEEFSEFILLHLKMLGIEWGQLNCELLVTEICDHLGIELEPDKEEWERAWDAYNPQPNDAISKLGFKEIFEAGQACEKSKEK